MSIYFAPEFAQNTVSGTHHRAQARVVQNQRRFFANQNAHLVQHNGQFRGNSSAIIPQDVYREFENQTTQIMRAPNLTLLNDLMGLARSLPVGKTEHVYRRVSDSGVNVSDLTGSTAIDMDSVKYDYDSSIKVFHRSGFGAEWMKIEAQRTEGFDELIDSQANAVRFVQETLASHIYNGATYKDGTPIEFKGIQAYGLRTSSKVVAVDLDADGLNIDFTSPAATGAAIRAAWIQLVDALRIANNVVQDITFYVSREIESNFQRFYDDAESGFGTIRDALLRLTGVGDIKTDAQLNGNEVMGLVLDAQFIRPLVGQAVSTVPMARLNPFDDYNMVTWANVGLEIKTDYDNRSGVLYARAIA